MSARQELLERLASTRKYRYLCLETLERIADWAISREPSVARASRIARRKLHQVYGAYWSSGDHRRLRAILDSSIDSAGSLESMCRTVLSLHASTRERLLHLERCYRDLWAITGSPTSVADLACGLSPFALPWMGLPASCPYHPSDIDSRVMDDVNRYLRHVGREESARCLDLLSRDALPEVDVCLILKTLSCLERQEQEAPARLLERIRCRWLVISMPTRSLGGHTRGMREHYRRLVGGLLAGRELQELDYPGEVFFVTRGD